jgi:anti-anti-sigma factor
MEFPIKEGNETRVTLTGKLDFLRSPILMQELETLRGKGVSKIIFECAELTYIASAGIRAIIFAKQKIEDGMDICLEDAAENVKEVIEMCGLDSFIEFARSK